MSQKTYTFPKIGGSDGSTPLTITKTLAPPTPKRTVDFLDLFGAKSFDELRTPSGSINYGIFVLDTGRDPEKLEKALDICLLEGTVDIDLSDFDLRISDEVIQDFFEQRSKTLLSRMNLS
jgi:hypothetical protein